MKKTAPVAAKINLALVVGEPQEDGRHEVVTVLQRIDICDRIELEPAATLEVEGFNEDTLVRSALTAVARTAGSSPAWRVRLRKRIPVAAGLGGGSADAAAALVLANETLPEPLGETALHELATTLGADVPFFLAPGPKLAQGGGAPLAARAPAGLLGSRRAAAPCTQRGNGGGVQPLRRDRRPRGSRSARPRLDALAACRRPRDFAAFPPNDLAAATDGTAPLVAELRERGAFRADVSGSGPAVYGLFHRREHAAATAANAPPRASGSPHPSGRFAG